MSRIFLQEKLPHLLKMSSLVFPKNLQHKNINLTLRVVPAEIYIILYGGKKPIFCRQKSDNRTDKACSFQHFFHGTKLQNLAVLWPVARTAILKVDRKFLQ